jgi:hypothetical protein
LWRIGTGLWTTRRRREIARNSRPRPLAQVPRGGIELSYQPTACGGKARRSRKVQIASLLAASGRWRSAGPDGLSGRSGATTRSPRGSWCSYHREPLTLFPLLPTPRCGRPQSSSRGSRRGRRSRDQGAREQPWEHVSAPPRSTETREHAKPRRARGGGFIDPAEGSCLSRAGRVLRVGPTRARAMTGVARRSLGVRGLHDDGDRSLIGVHVIQPVVGTDRVRVGRCARADART